MQTQLADMNSLLPSSRLRLHSSSTAALHGPLCATASIPSKVETALINLHFFHGLIIAGALVNFSDFRRRHDRATSRCASHMCSLTVNETLDNKLDRLRNG